MDGTEKRLLASEAWRVLAQRGVVPWISHFHDLTPDGDVLEIGSGAGFNAETFLDRYPWWRFTASDADPEMVAACAARLARFGPRVRVEHADATKLPYADATFDLVISLGVWHHVGDWERALAECRRVLRPGAHLLVADLLPGFFVGPVGRAFPPVRSYTLGAMRAQLADAGFARFRMRAAKDLWYRLIAETPDAVEGDPETPEAPA